jgi:type II secretory pathway pseudopilin PulG
MKHGVFVCLSALAISTLVWAPVSAQDKDAIQALKNELQQLRQQMEAQQKAYEARLSQMQKELEAVSKSQGKETAKTQLEAEVAKTQPQPEPAKPGAWERVKQTTKGLDIDLSVIIDANYHNSDTPTGIGEIKEKMAGFGHAHGGGHEHEHGGFEEGFNLREVELYLSGAVDP